MPFVESPKYGDFHPCVPHLVYLAKDTTKGGVLRTLRCNTEPSPSFEKRYRDIVVKPDGGVFEGDQRVGQVQQEDGGNWFIGLGKEEDYLHINIMMPTSKGANSELLQMVSSYLGPTCEKPKLEEFCNDFKENQRALMRRLRIAVEFDHPRP